MKVSFIVLVALVLSWNLLTEYVDYQLKNTDIKPAYSDCNKIWLSRGVYSEKSKQNEIPAINRAFDSGTLGVEFDFSYDAKRDRFIIGHSHPKMGKDGYLKHKKKNNGKALTMEDLFASLKEGRHNFWLDFKNLDKLSVEETQAAVQRLLFITKNNNLKNYLYIEGSNPLRLPMYTDAGFKTILGIHPVRESYFFSSIVINAFKITYYFTNISAIALAYGDIDDPVYGEKTEELLGNIPVFLFHLLHERKILESIIDKENVRVILLESKTGAVDLNDINMCQE